MFRCFNLILYIRLIVLFCVTKENRLFLVVSRLKEFPIGSGKVLVTKYQGKLSAVSSKCTHYGAPLITGAYKDGKIRCPWHGACFSAVTGDIEDYPGLDSLHSYDVSKKMFIIMFHVYSNIPSRTFSMCKGWLLEMFQVQWVDLQRWINHMAY